LDAISVRDIDRYKSKKLEEGMSAERRLFLPTGDNKNSPSPQPR